MSDRSKETADAISDGLRKEAARADEEQYYTLDDAAESMREFAERLDEALKRERAEFDCECAVIAELAAKEEAARHKPGNAAAMREALEMARDALKSAEKYVYGDPPNGDAIGWDDVWPSEWHNALEAVERALSAPARNCDIYPKRDDAGEAWNKTLDERTRDMVQRYPLTAMDMFIDWLLAYAEPDARGDLCHED